MALLLLRQQMPNATHDSLPTKRRATTMLRFIMGAVAGSLAVWFWGEELKRYANEGGRTIRSKAAETLESVEHTAGGMLDSAREQVHSTLQAGQEAVRPKTF
jgi:hypothetical protein